MLNLQVLALSLISVLSGIVPTTDGAMVKPTALLGIDEAVTVDFLVGTWSISDEFFRWGVTDREKARQKPLKGHAIMCLLKDGSMKMVNLFRPTEGRWEVTGQGLLIHDPKFPERGSQVLPVRKRDDNRIWLLLPFSRGAVGIGMVRVSEGEASCSENNPASQSVKRPKGLKHTRSIFSSEPHNVDDQLETKSPDESNSSESD
ncbi:MAG: hypothetical protein NTW27_11745 [Deltaproteobacteria bacterium]|nr:hypothetical protein [Deltaproteobacteria bacterium]